MDAYQSMYQNQEKETLDEMVGKGGLGSKGPLGPKGPKGPLGPKGPQDPATSKPVKDYIKARLDDSPKPESKVTVGRGSDSKSQKSFSDMKQSVSKPKSMIDTVRDRRQEVVSARREKVQKTYDKAREQGLTDGVDLLSAYHAVYEHHQKDENGNTVPHGDDVYDLVYNHFIEEGFSEKEAYEKMSNLTEEQLDEFISLALGAGKAALTALKGSKMVGNAVNAFSKVKNIAGKGINQVKNIAGKGINQVKDFARKDPITANNIGNRILDSGARDKEKVNKTGVAGGGSAGVYASADLFDIVKGQLLDEGLSEDEVRDIMLSLTPEEILKEIEESSLSAGSSGGHYSDGGDGVFRSKEQVGSQFNKNFPPAKNGKVDKRTRKAINTSARDFGIQGPTTLKQSVEPEGETI